MIIFIISFVVVYLEGHNHKKRTNRFFSESCHFVAFCFHTELAKFHLFLFCLFVRSFVGLFVCLQFFTFCHNTSRITKLS